MNDERTFRFYLLFAVVLSVFALHIRCSRVQADGKTWAVRMADSIMERNPQVYGDWDYVTGTVLKGFVELWGATDDQKYFDYIRTTVDAVVQDDGSIKKYKLTDYNIDEINQGRMLLFLYERTSEEKYFKAAQLLRRQLQDHPRTHSGGFWHKKRYPYQMWLDGIYMGCPFYAEYGRLFDERQNFDDVVRQILLIEKVTRDPQTGLLYHGWD
ncbi:glycoside hydrolase family 88 protein, partial [candidate division KSB1 bacterium]|nr:glycoside hydrolase family 88 protein [candidate division KSB1 bacterium]